MDKTSDAEMKAAIFKPNSAYSKEHSGPKEGRNEREAVCFAADKVEVEENDEDVLCKAVRINRLTFYYVRFNTDGHLFNPYGMYSNTEVKLRSGQGRKQSVLRQVGQKVFDFYLKFLETRNTANLHNAEREAS